MPIELGTKSVFIQHYAIVKDLDSLMEEGVTVTYREGTEDVEEKVERTAERKSILTFNGNTLEAEYQGTTGFTFLCEYKIPVGSTKPEWVKIEDLTASEVDMESLFVM